MTISCYTYKKVRTGLHYLAHRQKGYLTSYEVGSSNCFSNYLAFLSNYPLFNPLELFSATEQTKAYNNPPYTINKTDINK